MALYPKSHFASLCGLTVGNLGNYIKRGKVIMSGDYIDDSIPDNKSFLENRLAKIQAKNEDNQIVNPASAVVSITEPDIPNVQDPERKPISIPNTKSSARDATPSGKSRNQLEIEKKALEIEKLKVDTRLQELKEEKIRGEVIPISLVKGIIMNLSQSILTSHKDADEYLLIRISKEAKLSGDQLAMLRGEMIKSLNEAVEKAIKASQRNIKNLMDEFSIKKEVGEHD